MTLCEFGSISSAPITLLKKQSIAHDALRLLPANESLSRYEAMRSRNSPTVSLRDPSINCRNSGIDSNPKSDGLKFMFNRPLMEQLKQTSTADRAGQTTIHETHDLANRLVPQIAGHNLQAATIGVFDEINAIAAEFVAHAIHFIMQKARRIDVVDCKR